MKKLFYLLIGTLVGCQPDQKTVISIPAECDIRPQGYEVLVVGQDITRNQFERTFGFRIEASTILHFQDGRLVGIDYMGCCLSESPACRGTYFNI